MRDTGYRLTAAIGAVAGIAFFALAALGHVPGPWDNVIQPAVLPLAFYLAGLVAFRRRPDNAATGRLMAFGAAHLSAFALAALTVVMLREGWSGAWAANLASGLLYALGFAVFVALFAVFPDGRYERRYERVVTRTVTAGAIVVASVGSLAHRRPELAGLEPVTTGNPLYVSALRGAAGIEMSVAIGLVVAVVLFGLRYRRAEGDRRTQMRWPLAAALAGVVMLVLNLTLGSVLSEDVLGAAFVAVFALLPVSLMVAMVRHRLFDVELVLRRSVIFGVLWGIIALVYAGIAAVLGIAAGSRLPTSVAVLVAIAAAMAFEPARRRLERLADRLVFGRRRDGYAAIRSLGTRLEGVLDLSELPAVIAATVQDGLGARWVRVLMADRIVAGPDAEVEPEPELGADLVHAGERVGRIECGPRVDGEYGDADRDLLGALARQGALAVSNARLASELVERLAEVQRQADELRLSRTRIVQAAEIERRRIERDIHDGIQQEIVALMARIELARTQLELDPAAVQETLTDARSLIRQTQADLRELARGIHPAVLGDRGLAEAVAARAARLPLAVEIDADDRLDDVRFAPEIEGAMYFVISEALANVMKHAGAPHAAVRLAEHEGELNVEVADLGEGFDVGASAGSGLSGLRDRVEALGGSFDVISAPGEGTRVIAALAVRERERG